MKKLLMLLCLPLDFSFKIMSCVLLETFQSFIRMPKSRVNIRKNMSN